MATFTFKRTGNCGHDHHVIAVTGDANATRVIELASIRSRDVDMERYLLDSLAIHAQGKTNGQLATEFDSVNGWVLTV